MGILNVVWRLLLLLFLGLVMIPLSWFFNGWVRVGLFAGDALEATVFWVARFFPEDPPPPSWPDGDA